MSKSSTDSSGLCPSRPSSESPEANGDSCETPLCIRTCSGFSELSHRAAREIWGRNWTACRNHEYINHNRRCLATTVGFIYQKAMSFPVLSHMGACLCIKLAISFHQMLPQRCGNECKIKAQAAKRMDQADPTNLCCLWKNLVLTSVST